MINEDFLISFIYKIFPEKIINNHAYSINKFIFYHSKTINKKNIKILDIGAGETPYKQYFNKCKYFSQDVINNPKKTIDYICDSKNIPVKDNSFDFILCTQVLEHVKEPHLVIKEMFRILKKGGKVFLTTHLCMEEHMIPYDYFRFTRYGLSYLAKSNGFRKAIIAPQGGRFIALSKMIQTAIPHILTKKYLIYLYYLIAIVPIFLINLILYYLDKLDKQKLLTTNYECIFIK